VLFRSERAILFDTTGTSENVAKKVISSNDLKKLQLLVRKLPVGESVISAILELVRSARPGTATKELEEFISWGPGPRASQALMLTARARALLDSATANGDAPLITWIGVADWAQIDRRGTDSFTLLSEATASQVQRLSHARTVVLIQHAARAIDGDDT